MGIWDRLFTRQASASKEVAKERLKAVLVYDRARISPGLLDTLRDEIVRGISKHVDVDQSNVQLSLTYDRGRSQLVANIPLKTSARHGSN